MRRTGLLFLVLAVALLAPPDLGASCQTDLCRKGYQEGNRQREARLLERIGDDPTDRAAYDQLLRLLEGKVSSELAIDAYEMRNTWEPPPGAAARDALEAEVAEEIREVTALRAAALADDPAAWCAHVRSLADPEERLVRLEERLVDDAAGAAGAAGAELVACLGRELAAQDRATEAHERLRAFLDTEPAAEVYRALIELHDREHPHVGELLAEQALRRPDDMAAQRSHLHRLLRFRSTDEEKSRGIRLARELLERPLTGSDHHSICSALRRAPDEERLACWRHLRTGPLEGDEVDAYRRMALSSQLMIQIHAERWSEVDALTAQVEAAQLWETWQRQVDWSDGARCPQFLEWFVERGGDTDPDQASSWVRLLRECGADDRAERLVAKAGLRLPDGSDPTENQVTIHHLRRTWAGRTGSEALPKVSWNPNSGSPWAPGLFDDLERWVESEPDSLAPLVFLALFHERAGRPDEALGAWSRLVALRPDDLDLQVAQASAALRLGAPETVGAVARRLANDRTASRRHRAEGRYLEGRLAYRAERRDEASEHLTTYFLERLRATGCRRVEACDQALLVHLVRSGDEGAAERYLAARREAIEEYRRRLALLAPSDAAPVRPTRRFRPWAEIDTSVLDAADAEAADTELPDPDAAFPDTELLALSWEMRQVD